MMMWYWSKLCGADLIHMAEHSNESLDFIKAEDTTSFVTLFTPTYFEEPGPHDKYYWPEKYAETESTHL